jgi:hypothetical protein
VQAPIHAQACGPTRKEENQKNSERSPVGNEGAPLPAGLFVSGKTNKEKARFI